MAQSLLDSLGPNRPASHRNDEGFGLWREVDRVFDNLARSFNRQTSSNIESDRLGPGGFAQEVLKPADGRLEPLRATEPLRMPVQAEPESQSPQPNVIRVNRGTTPTGPLSPVSDACEDGEGFEVYVELPGVRPEDLEIEFAEGSISLTATRRDIELGEKKLHIKERSRGTYQRRFKIPFQSNPDTITAAFDNGVVRLFVPHPPETKPRSKKIELKATH
jgi:HSP20 family molecular chaperone IbpA